MKGDFSRLTYDPKRSYHGVLAQQGRVQLDSDTNEAADIDAYLNRVALVDTLGRWFVSKVTPDAFAITPTKGSFTIGVGRLWVDGFLAECFGTGGPDVDPVTDVVRGTDPVPYDAQPFFPEPPPLPDPPYLVYVDVWQRSVTAAEDPSLVDPALGGADTAARIQTVWQVRAVAGGELPQRTLPGTLTVSGEFSGFENRLYRVEIHDAGTRGEATFTWSRDNGATAAPVAAVEKGGVVLSRGLLRLGAGDLVELLDDRDELAGRRGMLAHVKQARGRDRVGLDAVIDPAWFPRAIRPRLRRWEGHGPIGDVELEDGIGVSFGEGSYRTGDWWVFPARAPDASVETLQAAPPRGIHHHICELAWVTGPNEVEDRRPSGRKAYEQAPKR